MTTTQDHRSPAEIDTEIAKNDAEIQRLLDQLQRLRARNAKLDDVYKARRWSRFFPAVTNSQPHIHRSVNCQTLHHGREMTQMSWATQMSGMTEAEAVDALDEALCSVCFPSAPVALREYVSRKSQAEQAERQAAKDARNTVKAAKTLEPGEVFKTTGRWSESVTTVAKCKELVRQPIATAAELEWYRSGKAATAHSAGAHGAADPEFYERVAGNLADRLAAEEIDAAQAVKVLLAREARQAGHGATEADIEKMQTNAAKRAAKDWA